LVRAVHTFLIGGGRDSAAAHEPFARAAGGPVVAFVLDAGAGDLKIQSMASWSDALDRS
jgi:hypothetical protein